MLSNRNSKGSRKKENRTCGGENASMIGSGGGRGGKMFMPPMVGFGHFLDSPISTKFLFSGLRG